MKYLIINPWFCILMIIAILIAVFRNKLTGLAGEYWVKQELNKLSNEYKIINDVMIRTNDGKTHQIDHVVISKYGIFVIETKQYNGYIVGNDYDKKWLIKAGNNKYYINNPVHQNYGHIKSLKEVLNINDEKLISIVCISSNAKVNVKSEVVVTIDKFLQKIRSYDKEIISNVDELYSIICDINIIDKNDRNKHIKDTKKIKHEKTIESINKCPKCGGKLIERNGKYGYFIGCSNYPRCKYIKK